MLSWYLILPTLFLLSFLREHVSMVVMRNFLEKAVPFFSAVSSEHFNKVKTCIFVFKITNSEMKSQNSCSDYLNPDPVSLQIKSKKK